MQRRRLFVILLVLLLVCTLVFCCTAAFFGSALGENFDNTIDYRVLDDGNENETVAVIQIEGIITSQGQVDLFGNETPDMTSQIISKIDHAENDDNVKAILLEVDSPGGEAYASKLIHNRLKRFNESDKPLVVLMKNSAASGAYMVSVPADEIIASPITTTGSIGVLVTGTDLTGLYEKVGIKEYNVVNSEGNLKVLESLTDKESESYQILQSILDDVYDDFVTMVADGRGMSKDRVTQLADGRIYSGRQAEENGLVDTLGEQDDAREAVKNLAELEDPKFVLYGDRTNSFSIYSVSLKNMLLPELAAVQSKTPGISVQYLMKI